MKRFAFTLDLESDYSGLFTEQYEIFKTPDRIKELLDILMNFGVPTSIFCVGRIFELFPEIIKLFEQYKCEFHVHSYSHDLNSPDSESEITASKNVYFNYFKRFPIGYRSPQGKITAKGISLLEKHSYLFDSSIFPSFYPNPFLYFFKDRNVHAVKGSTIVEIPFTSITPIRLNFAMSYVKYFGLNFYKNIFKLFPPPDFICFDSHLHDLIFNKNSYDKLPSIIWKKFHGRNNDMGLNYLKDVLSFFSVKGYSFCGMTEVYESYIKERLEREDNRVN